MASASQIRDPVPSSSQSDYGSDIEETALTELLTQAESQHHHQTTSQNQHLQVQPLGPKPPTPLPNNNNNNNDNNNNAPTIHHSQRFARVRTPVRKKFIDELGVAFEAEVWEGPLREPSLEVEYHEANRGAFSPRRVEGGEFPRGVGEEGVGERESRSPLQRFRSPPKKPLSVTDLVGPAWCELQYWYNLTKYGRVLQTPAMRQGSGVHKVLEEQVHGKEVAVEVTSREDAFALRLWNGIQSLRTLRVTGMTREFEVWGLVEGEVVIGVIDEICTTCPDEAVEAGMLEAEARGDGDGKKGKSLETNQTTLTNFLSNSSRDAGVLEDSSAWLGSSHERPRTFYVVDIKTRQSRSLPKHGSPSRPTHIQLQLYHRLLTSLAANTISPLLIFGRYRLDPNTPFSDRLIQQIGGLDFNFPSQTNSDSDSPVDFESPTDAVSELLSHNNLHALWTLFITELQKTIPNPATSISPLLAAEFRAADDGSLIGKRCFAFDGRALDRYVRDEMGWWRGERPAKGVEIEDAYKCGFCKFAEGCEWRLGRVEEQARKMRLRREGRGKSLV